MASFRSGLAAGQLMAQAQAAHSRQGGYARNRCVDRAEGVENAYGCSKR